MHSRDNENIKSLKSEISKKQSDLILSKRPLLLPSSAELDNKAERYTRFPSTSKTR
jgi:hypothetical protein